jgi:hypothetical protein
MVFDTKAYWMTNRQSQCNFDFDFDNPLRPIFSSEGMLRKDYYRKS